ncbi:cysteine desulfurase family protein [Siminovitchia fortis]|uniref:Cysteine desulfurase n=1 Tax=Siminovitchia fortis TaxID=254758 RepID=A0A443INM3_9BACI|nr:cysteine desulfurase family protein [Siminovitchia fortis]RWR07760.1 cysteine desulfurase [Siminovitchia fortis]WHY82306.1 cysteine desulfurase family protein [Siminovitchia fortis]
MIYFDNSATTKPYEEVLQAFAQVNRDFFGNPSSLHALGGRAEQLLKTAREQIAQLARVHANEIYFTSGGSESNNLAIKGTALMHRGRGNHIITTSVEHPSVQEACEQLRMLGFEITYIDVDQNGHVSADDVIRAITDKTILVSMIHVNNEVGTIQPVEEVGRRLKDFPKVLFHVDNVQGACKVPLDIYRSNIDFCTFSAHKFHGLKGSGFLFVKKGVKIFPLISGGNQEKNLRSGTENTGGIVAMAKAFRMAEDKRRSLSENLLELRNYIMNQLEEVPGLVIHTPRDNAAPHIVNVSAVGLKGEVIVHALEEQGIFISTTSACSSKDKTPSGTLKAMGVSEEEAAGAVRISLSYDNTPEEAEKMVHALKQVIDRLNKVMRRNK